MQLSKRGSLYRHLHNHFLSAWSRPSQNPFKKLKIASLATAVEKLLTVAGWLHISWLSIPYTMSLSKTNREGLSCLPNIKHVERK